MTGPLITMPDFPALGVPTGMKQAGQRVDFRPDQYDLLIETKGYLLAWTRACVCPCAPVATQTENPDPNCTLCGGSGWLYFGASDASTTQDLSEYDLDDLQKTIVEGSDAMVIRGVLTSLQSQYSPWDKLGNWQAGTMQVTVRHENKLGYYDKLVSLDSTIVYSEIVDADGSNLLAARYPVAGVNYIRSATTEYKPDGDFTIDSSGRILWNAGQAPSSGTRLALHYICHPTWLLVEHPHVIRTTSRKFKTASPRTPTGDPRSLPIQGIVRYDFIP